jgi:NAD(P)-dependent dehydrogenase (short-subunit alcohol dehydrogenase family)
MTNDPPPLQGRTAVITGAGVRIGRAIALALAAHGANVVVHYGRSRDEAETTAADIRRLGRRAITVSADLAQPVQAAATIFDAADSLGGADLLINSAAVFDDAPLADTSEELYDCQLDVNLKAPFFLCREFVRRLPPDRRGHIVNLADWRAETPPADYMAYTLSKAGVVALTKGLALQLAPRVQVNAIAPGAILPPPGGDERSWRDRKLPDVPLRRTGSTDDIAAAALYLVRSGFVTGEVLHVTGGEHL